MSFGERYLVDPDLFPARLAGEPWGSATLVVDVAGGPYVFRDLTPPQAALLRRRYDGFARPETAPLPMGGVVCRAFRVAANEFHRFELAGLELTFARDYEERAVRLAGIDVMARIELRDDGVQAALWTSNGDPEHFHGALENVFRVLVAYRTLALGGVLLHSAGIIPAATAEAAAIICCGPSGTGKSTLSRLALAAGQQVASDDLNAVLPGGASFEFQPLPFAGDVRPAAWDAGARPLAAVCRLAQGAAESVAPLSTAAAAASLVACAPYVNADPHRGDRLLAVLERLLHSIPAYRLTFALAGRAPRLLESIVR